MMSSDIFLLFRFLADCLLPPEALEEMDALWDGPQDLSCFDGVRLRDLAKSGELTSPLSGLGLLI